MALEELALLSENWAAFPIGSFPFRYGPWGEYHYMPPGGARGDWYEPTCATGWQQGRWQVIEEDGVKWMEQMGYDDPQRGIPMLVAGDRLWADLDLTVTVRPLSLSHPVGIMARYQDSRNHMLLRLVDGQAVELVRAEHEEETVLARVPWPYDADHAYALRIAVGGHCLRAWVDDVEVADLFDNTWSSGRIGLWAVAPARFGSVTVRQDRTARQIYLDLRAAHEKELDVLRERNPKPALWRALNTSGFGCGRTLRLGDLTGDGRPELVFVQHVRRHRTDSHVMASCVTAMTLEGDVLWQVGEPSSDPAHAYDTCDVACQVHDWTGDGRAEVVLCKDFWLQVLDGRTGTLRTRVRMPETTPGEEDTFARVNGDSLYFCDLSGAGRPSDLLVKNRYKQVWAYDADLRPLWSHRCNTGHYCHAYDMDGDGRDEVQVGYTLLNHDGSVIWENDLGDHVDEIVIGHFDPQREDPQIAVVAGEAGFIIFDAQGQVLVQDRIGHAQRLSAARYRLDLPGLQFYAITFWGNPSIIVSYDGAGRRLHSFQPTSTGHVLNPVNWTGDGTEYALMNANVRHGGLLDGWGRVVVTLPDDGHPDTCCEALNLTGDPRDELMVWDHQRLFIYSQDRPFRGERIYRPRRRPHHNLSNYRGESSFSHWQPWGDRT